MKQKTVVYFAEEAEELKKKIDKEYGLLENGVHPAKTGWFVHQLILLSKTEPEADDYLVVYRQD